MAHNLPVAGLIVIVIMIVIVVGFERTHAKMQLDINSKVKTERGGRHDADAARVLCLPFSFKCKYI